MEKNLESVKIAVALRAARTALGWGQQEFAEKMGVAKSTVARIETLEMAAKADFLTRAVRLFRQAGLTVDCWEAESVSVTIGLKALHEAQQRLEDETLRRSDRQARKGGGAPEDKNIKPEPPPNR